MFKKLMCFAAIGLIVFRTVSEPLSVLAIAEIGDDLLSDITIEDWYGEDGELQYPLTMDDERWHELFSSENMYQACQIPEKILQELSTEELLYMVEQYPNFTVLTWYENPQDSFSSLRENFNGLEELMQRVDCKDVVLEEYEQLSVSQQTRYDYDANIKDETAVEDMNRIMKDKDAMRLVRQDAQEIYIVSLLEMILAQDEIQNQFEVEDTRRLGNALIEKMELKAHSECFEFQALNNYTEIAGTDNDTVKYIYMKEQFEIKEQEVIDQVRNEAGLFTSIKPPVTVLPILYTRSGNVIPCEVAKEVVISKATVIACVGKFSECTILEYKEYGYNCFAYAWLSLDARNRPYRKKVNLPDASVLKKDPAYKLCSTAGVGRLVLWDAHAGIVEQTNYSYFVGSQLKTEPLVSSAWGCGALVLHPLSQGDFGLNVNFIK